MNVERKREIESSKKVYLKSKDKRNATNSFGKDKRLLLSL